MEGIPGANEANTRLVNKIQLREGLFSGLTFDRLNRHRFPTKVVRDRQLHLSPQI